MMLAGDLEGTQRRNSVPVNGPVTSYTGLDLDVTPLQGGGKWVEKEFPKFGGRGGGEKKGWGLGWFFWATVEEGPGLWLKEGGPWWYLEQSGGQSGGSDSESSLSHADRCREGSRNFV